MSPLSGTYSLEMSDRECVVSRYCSVSPQSTAWGEVLVPPVAESTASNRCRDCPSTDSWQLAPSWVPCPWLFRVVQSPQPVTSSRDKARLSWRTLPALVPVGASEGSMVPATLNRYSSHCDPVTGVALTSSRVLGGPYPQHSASIIVSAINNVSPVTRGPFPCVCVCDVCNVYGTEARGGC